MPDIDIDFADRNVILDKINHRVAKLNKDKKHKRICIFGVLCEKFFVFFFFLTCPYVCGAFLAERICNTIVKSQSRDMATVFSLYGSARN